MFLSPGGNSIMGANVTSQYEQTIKRDIEADLPRAFVARVNTQKAYIDFINGHRLMFRPYDQPDKLRSYNVDFFLILEGSECKMNAYTQLQSRCRNLAATAPKRDEDGEIIYDYTDEGVAIPQLEADWRKGIVESNPDSGWIRSEVLYKSGSVQKHGNVMDPIQSPLEEKDKDQALASHISASDVNRFLPPTFLRDLSASKPHWWIKRMIYGSFSYAEGLVYPGAQKCVIPQSALPTIPSHWPRVIAFDYGLRDDSVFLFAAIDPIHDIIFIYKEVRTNNKSVKELAALFKDETKDIPVGGMLMPPIIDPKSAPKRDYDKKSLSDHFLEYGIVFKPGQISIDARVFRLNTYLESGKLRIVDCCTGLIQEISNYKFLPRSLDLTVYVADKPEDKNNHGINPLEWIVMELPEDPAKLLSCVYDRGVLVNQRRRIEDKKQIALHPLSDYDYNNQQQDEAYSYNNGFQF